MAGNEARADAIAAAAPKADAFARQAKAAGATEPGAGAHGESTHDDRGEDVRPPDDGPPDDRAPRALAGPWTVDTLDAFVARCDALGGIGAPDCRRATEGFGYRPGVAIDVGLDPFSDAYFDQQLALYTELSGRSLDQTSGEITPVDVDPRVGTPNPYGEDNVGFISRHCRTVLTAMMVANLPRAARVLDLGAGWGLSSEMIAYTGARVTAVDINPAFIDLMKRRAARTGLSIEVVQSNFDDLAPQHSYDLMFFYECLHHAVKPWETLAKLAPHLAPGGRVAFAGEPVNTIWWPHWGMRLDAESVYVMRKFGWFESGWSEGFICDCLRHAGLEPTILPHIGLDGREICVAHKAGDPKASPIVVPPGTTPYSPPLQFRPQPQAPQPSEVPTAPWWRRLIGAAR